jgi:ADP-L-glycero-D-manno-heptose 6-epimerase
MKKICVTGNHGFIGRALFNEIEKMGYIPLGVEKWIFDRVRWQDRLIEYLVNLNPDAVFHVGACSDTQNKNINEMMVLNVETTMILADWCQHRNIPLIYSSSAATYGTRGEPETLYAWSKYLAEIYVTKCRGIALRYFNVYGMDESHKGEMASLAYKTFLSNRKGEKMKLFPNSPTRDFVYIKDIVSANIHALNNYDLHRGGRWDVGTGESRLFEDLVTLMGGEYEYLSEDKIPDNYQTWTCADEYKFMKGWTPEWKLEKGIENYKALLELSTPHL